MEVVKCQSVQGDPLIPPSKGHHKPGGNRRAFTFALVMTCALALLLLQVYLLHTIHHMQASIVENRRLIQELKSAYEDKFQEEIDFEDVLGNNNNGDDEFGDVSVARAPRSVGTSSGNFCSCAVTEHRLDILGRRLRINKTYLTSVKYQCLKSPTAHLVPSGIYGNRTMDLQGARVIQWTAANVETNKYAYAHNDGLFNLGRDGLQVNVTGKYQISVHLTLAGRTDDSRNMSHVHCAFTTGVVRPVDGSHAPLMYVIHSQLERGRYMEIATDNRRIYPYDTGHMTGIFILYKNDLIQVKPAHDSPYCRLALVPNKVFFTAVLLEERIGGTAPVTG